MLIAFTIRGMYIVDEEKCSGYGLCITVYLMGVNKTGENWVEF